MGMFQRAQVKRFYFTPFWKLTRWGWLFCNWPGHGCPFKIHQGCDEYHNTSRYLIVPFVGDFTLFDRDYDASQPEHIYSYSPERGFEGADVTNCAVCTEVKEELLKP